MAQNPLDAQAKLVGLADPVKGKEFPLTGPVKVGRDQKSANVAVVHASVSRQHASIFQEGGVWTVEDLKSTNGVFVNETRTPKAQLKDGDVLRIGDIPFKFELIQAQTIIGAKAVVEPDEALTMPSPRPVIAPSAAAASKLQVPSASRLPASPPPSPPSIQPAARAQAPSAPAAPPPPLARPAPPPPLVRPAPPPPLARPAPPPPLARPAPPPPAARPAQPPQAPPQPEAGGEDLFEPSIVGPVNIRATMDAAAKPAPAARPSARQPEDFEGTMYGGQVAKVLAKEIREEKPVPEDSGPKQKGAVVPQVLIPGVARKPPSFFWLKVKFFVFAAVILGTIGALLYYGHLVTVKKEELQKKYSVVKREVDAFVPRESVSGGDLNDDLAALKRLRELIRKEELTFQGEKEWMARLKDRSNKVAFWTFEREFKLKVDKRDEVGANKLIDDMDATCTTRQRRLLPLCKLIVRYELFGKKYPDSPEQATKAPDRKEVSDLCKEDASFSRQWKDYKGDFESEGKQLYEQAKHADEIARTSAQRWDRFWTDYSQYKDNKTTEALERLKRDFPHLDILLQEKN